MQTIVRIENPKRRLNQDALHNAQANKARIYEDEAQAMEKSFSNACVLCAHLEI